MRRLNGRVQLLWGKLDFTQLRDNFAVGSLASERQADDALRFSGVLFRTRSTIE
jgi:hypothetical protein